MIKENDFLKRLNELYKPSDKGFVTVDVPENLFLMIDGEGDPAGAECKLAIKWLFTILHPIKQMARKRMGKNYVEPPLEGLFWGDAPADFVAGNKAKIKWRMMIVLGNWLTDEMFVNAKEQAAKKLGVLPKTLRVESFNEGKSVHIMHRGSYDEIKPKLDQLYQEFLPENNLLPHGYYHEIYLNDPSRVAPKKLKTLLRQPVK